jgi:prephenate dehydrogenase
MKTAVVGGAGKMGVWIARFLRSEDIDVVLIDNNKDRLAAACTELKVSGTTDFKAVSDSDLIIISVPIAAFGQIAEALSPFVQKGQIIIDVTSVKAMPVEVMHKHFSECTVLGVHPVFGPGATAIKGHNVVLTPTGDDEKALAEKARAFLEKRGARVELMTPAEHDRRMAVVLGLAHYIAIVSGDTLLDIDNLADMEIASGITFRVLMTLVASVLGEDPSLYAAIQTSLPELPAFEESFINKASEWAKLVKNKESAEFTSRMSELRAKLGRISLAPGEAYRNMYRITDKS